MSQLADTGISPSPQPSPVKGEGVTQRSPCAGTTDYATPVMPYWSAVWVALDLSPLRSVSAWRKLTVTTVWRFCLSLSTSMVNSLRSPGPTGCG